LLGPEILLAGQILLGLLDLHLAGFERLPHLLERALGHAHRRRAVVHARLERLGVDLQQELALGDAIAFIHREVHHSSGSVRADVDLTLRLDLARGRHNRVEVARFDGLGDHSEGRRPFEPQIGRDDGGANQDDGNSDEDVPAIHLRS
jgi:hypothetical protein